MTDPLREAADTMRAVRDRCVWTQQIDHRALVPYLVEESAELIDAVEDGTRDDLREELGDLLWQVLFHAEIASRDADEPFDIDDVAAGSPRRWCAGIRTSSATRSRPRPKRCSCTGTPRRPPRSSARTSVLDGVSHADAVARARPEAPRQGAPRWAVDRRERRRRRPRRGRARRRPPRLVAAARANGWDAERALRERLRAARGATSGGRDRRRRRRGPSDLEE